MFLFYFVIPLHTLFFFLPLHLVWLVVFAAFGDSSFNFLFDLKLSVFMQMNAAKGIYFEGKVNTHVKTYM